MMKQFAFLFIVLFSGVDHKLIRFLRRKIPRIAVLLTYTEFSPAFTIHNDDSSDPTKAVDNDSFDQLTNFES